MSTASLDVRVSRPTPTSAIARATPDSIARNRSRGAPATPKELLDTLVRALWLFLGRVDEQFAGWTVQAGICRASELERILDLLAAASGDADFPYPGSPRFDGVGGGARIAADGSPGVPPAWVRYFMRGTPVSTEECAQAHGPLLLALSRLAGEHHRLWTVYAAHCIQGRSVPDLATVYRVTPATIRRRVTQARTLLLGFLGLYVGAIDDADFETLKRLTFPSPPRGTRENAPLRTHRSQQVALT